MLYIKALFSPIYRNTMGWGKAKEKEMVSIYIGNSNSYPMYIGKIHKKKRLSSIYIVKHIFF